MTNLSLDRPIAFIDTETTGTNPSQDRIVEIAVIKMHPDGQEELLNSLINPGIPIPPESTEIHGITDADVAGKPSFKEFSSHLFEFIKDCDIGGFSVYNFDLPILESEFQRAGILYSRFERRVVDVMAIYHQLDPRNLIAAYKKYCGKKLEGSHRAEADVRATIEVLKSQLEQHKELPRDIKGLHNFCSRKDPTWIDSFGKFVWSENDVIFNFGAKHKGKKLQDVAKEDPDHLNWIATVSNCSAEVKKITSDALKGVFPQKLK